MTVTFMCRRLVQFTAKSHRQDLVPSAQTEYTVRQYMKSDSPVYCEADGQRRSVLQ